MFPLEFPITLPYFNISLQLAGCTTSAEVVDHTVVTHGSRDVVSCPVNTSDWHPQTTCAAFVHVASNGATQARQAEQTTTTYANIITTA